MNQNDMQNQQRQLSPEELQQTQVINLKDLEEVVRFEKRTSKKPAIILGIIGLALLIGGSSFQIATVLKEKREAEEKIIEQRRNQVVEKDYLSCEQTKSANDLDYKYSFSYDFENQKLVKATKVLSISPTPGKPNGAAEVTKYKDEIRKIMKTTDGYESSLTDIDNGFIITTNIDYNELDLEEVKEQNKNIAISVDYKKNTLKSVITSDMKNKNFICK